jgi:hypothetical protein
MKSLWIVIGLASLAPIAAATDLNLSVESGGTNAIVVAPGDSVNWSVVGALSDGANEGLAFFVFDVSFDGGSLTQAGAPTSAPMTSFDSPLGLVNPAGFGGTVYAGDLIQVGGAQNTINNTFAAEPIGTVLPGVASPGAAETLVTGSLTAPVAPGTYTLSLGNVMANVIRQGETGSPFWAVDAAGVGTVTDLTIEVVAFSVDVETASIAGLGTQNMFLDAGDLNAGRNYFILGSVTGTSPGLNLASGLHIPLNVDVYFLLLVDLPNILIAPQIGTLDGTGQATATFFVPPGTPASLIGVTLQHAFVLLSPKDFASNVVDLTLVP